MRRLAGGRNSAVFAADLDGDSVCLKLHRVDERDRAEREWRALRLLARRAPGLAPVPRLYDPGPPRPIVVMGLLPGRHLDGGRQTCSENGSVRWDEATGRTRWAFGR